MDNNDFILGNRIRDWRRQFDVTQEQLASAVGVSRQSIISLESGKCLPSVPLALSISHFFDFPLEELFIIEFEPEAIASDGIAQRTIRPFDDLIEHATEALPMREREPKWVPLINVYQTEHDVVVEAAVPGLTEADIDIEIQQDVLTIKGERQEEQDAPQKLYSHQEMAYGSFERSITLPSNVNPEKASATVTKGQLTVVLPKNDSERAKVHKLKAKSIQ